MVPLAFGVPFGQAGGAFVMFWTVNFAGMAALGLANENMSMALGAGRPWTLVWLLFWATTNALAALTALELAPAFFAWARAWPLYHVAQASRRILFDLGDSGSGKNTGNDIGFHFGVLVAWILLDTAIFPVCFSYMRWRMRYERLSSNHLAEERYARSATGATATADADADAVVNGETECLKR